MKIYKQFEKFASKGNMIDIALGIILGSAFMETIEVFVKNVLLPPIALLFKSVELKDKKVILSEDVFLEYGLFLESFLSFVILGIILIGIFKFVNHIRDKAFDTEDDTVETPKDIQLLTDILKELRNEKNNR